MQKVWDVSGRNQLRRVLRKVHDDNCTAEHFAKDPCGRTRSTMFLTAFVYEFFIYNSLYQVDWSKSTASGNLKYHANGRERPNKWHLRTS